MTATEAVKKIMEKAGISKAKLAARIGCPGGLIYERLTQDNISIKKLNQMLAALDYEIVLQPKTSARRPEGHYVVDAGEKK